MLILQRPWTEQPQEAASFQLSDGLVAAYHPLSPTGWANSGGVTVRNGTDLRGPGGANIGAAGVSGLFVPGSAQYLSAPLTVSTPLTMMAVFRRVAASEDRALVSVGASTNDRHLLYVNQNAVAMFSGAGGTTAQATGPAGHLTTSAGPLHVAVGVVREAAGREVWCDGFRLGTNGTNVSPVASSTAAVGAYWTSGAPTAGFYFNGHIFLAAVWNRALTPFEVASISFNPWQLFHPARTRVPLSIGAASGLPTLSAATYVPGSLTASGFRPRVTATY